jgi:hypothetical protein
MVIPWAVHQRLSVRQMMMTTMMMMTTEMMMMMLLQERGGYFVNYIGIIDMLQTYNVQKQMERGIKRVAGQSAQGISAINSHDYAVRFMNYVKKIVPVDEKRDAQLIRQFERQKGGGAH